MAIELMAIGMSYNDYWHNDFEIADYYIAAYRRKQEVQMESDLTKLDILAYRIGEYVGTTTAIALGAKVKYPEKPLGFNFDKDNGLQTATDQQQIENEMKCYLSKKNGGA